MKSRLACTGLVSVSILVAACQQGSPTEGGPAGAESAKSEPKMPMGLPKGRETTPASDGPAFATPASADRAQPGARREVAPPPRLAFIYQSGFSGRVTEVGKDSISVQGFSMGIVGARADLDRRKGSITWTGWPPGKLFTRTPWPPGEPFIIQFAPLSASHNIRAEVKPFNNGIDSGPGIEMSAIQVVWTRSHTMITHPEGKETVLRRNDEPPRTFSVEWSYTVGVVPDDLRAQDTYRLSDLHVGDEVHLSFRHDLDNGAPNIVHGIRIERRPGGQIPLPPGGKRASAVEYRDRQQAYQDFEEKGTPIPLRFLTPDEQSERLAPPPRGVGPSSDRAGR